MKLTPAAWMRTRTAPAAGSPGSCRSRLRTSGPPVAWITTARGMRPSSHGRRWLSRRSLRHATGPHGPARLAVARGPRMGLLDLFSGATGVRIGDPAPDFALADRERRTVRLSDYRGKQPVVLYFYPKDDTPWCTKEACTFRDDYEVFKEAGGEVMGVTADPVEAHARCASKARLPFGLLRDRVAAV